MRSFQDRFEANVWWGLVSGHLIGPHIFDQSLNANRYLNFLQNDFLELIENFDLKFRKNLIYMQDEAPHWARIITIYLNEHFLIEWIDYGSPYVQWPPRSSDLTPLDFYLWEYLKTLVYWTPIESHNQLGQQIRYACDVVRADVNTIENATNTIVRCFELCYDNSGRYFINL